jgi:hypothetical protein
MQLSATTIAVLGAAVLVIVLALLFRRSGPRRSASRGPNNLHFVCAGCKGQFTHTKRTVGAWERGTRRFFCDSCHRSWREANPSASSKAGQSTREVPRSSFSRSLVPARSGCMSVIVVVAVVPLLLYALARYA